MGLARTTGSEDVTDDADVRAASAQAYASVDDVDLRVGGLAETPLAERGSQLGELFAAIVARQFDELREGLAFVEDVTLARLIRDNTSIGDELQDDVFFVAR